MTVRQLAEHYSSIKFQDEQVEFIIEDGLVKIYAAGLLRSTHKPLEDYTRNPLYISQEDYDVKQKELTNGRN